MPSLIVLALFGLAAQMIDGSLGMAYGVTSSTLLVAYGISPAMASASVHLAEVGTSLMSGISHHRFGNVDWGIVVRLALPGAVGAFAGATVLSALATDVAVPVTAAVLLTLGVMLLIRFATRGVRTDRMHLGFRGHFLVPLGLVAGFVDATGGGGWGPIATPTMLISGRTQPHRVVGSVSASEFVVALAASLGFLLGLRGEAISWRIVVGLLLGGAVAAPFAAWLVRRVAPGVLGALVGGVVTVTNTRTILLVLDVGSPLRPILLALVLAGSLASIGIATVRHRCGAPSVDDLDLTNALA